MTASPNWCGATRIWAPKPNSLDKSIMAAVSKDRTKRDPAAEQRARERISAIATERAKLQKTLVGRIPRLLRAVESAAADVEGNPVAAFRRRGDGAVRSRREGKLRLCDYARWLRLEADPDRRRCVVGEDRSVPPRPRYRKGERCLRQVRVVRPRLGERALCDAAGADRAADPRQAQPARRALRRADRAAVPSAGHREACYGDPGQV